jgi:hypothetical protein
LEQVPAFYSKILFQSQPSDRSDMWKETISVAIMNNSFMFLLQKENSGSNILKLVWKSVIAMKVAIAIKVRLFLQKVYFKNILKVLKKND